VISGPAYFFKVPDAIALSGSHLFVANEDDNSVTELPA
jgi:hypothetical protein